MPHTTRRNILTAGALGLGLGLTGCSSTTVPVLGGNDPDDEQRRLTAKSEQSLIALYSVVMARFPGLRTELADIQNQHSQHLTAITTDLNEPLTTPEPPRAPTGRADALTKLRKAERSAAKARTTAAVATQDPTLAQMLARIGTSESAHAALLVETIR